MSVRPPRAEAPAAARVFGWGGLLPFVGLTVILFVRPAVTLQRLLLEYGAVILSFVGALHWGYAVAAEVSGARAWQRYGWSVVPALLGWASLSLPTHAALRVQALTFVVCLAADRRLTRDTLPGWMPRLRSLLTTVAVLSLLSASLR